MKHGQSSDSTKCEMSSFLYQSSAQKKSDIVDPRSSCEMPSFEHVPCYHDFLLHPELYMRFHIHIIGLHQKKGKTKSAGAIRPYVKIETVGDDTGSTDFFDIGTFRSPTLPKTDEPIWDMPTLLIAKKGPQCTSGLKFGMYEDHVRGTTTKFEFILHHTRFETIGGEEWVEMVEDVGNDQAFFYKIRITDGADRIVSKQDLESFCSDFGVIEYNEMVLEGATELDNALLQCWTHMKEVKSNRAVLWIIGRNDCFMHPHVAMPLFIDNGYDLYVLNYSADGATRRRGWVHDPHFNSHNRHGDFDVYIGEIEKALEVMSRRGYESVIGYAHSTGGPVLLNYLIEKGDKAFTGFIFNSPFLDIPVPIQNVVAKRAAKFYVHYLLGTYEALGFSANNNRKFFPAKTPDAFKHNPIKYLGQDIVLSAWSAKIWSNYYFDWRNRPLYEVPMTRGFMRGVSNVHRKIRAVRKKRRIITSKPFLVMTSRADDVLVSEETLFFADCIGPARCEIELVHNAHDIFLTTEKKDVKMAIEMTKCWMKCQGYAKK